MSRDIFLSYARKDREIAEKLVRRLEISGFNVWWDFHIPSGRSFASVIAEKLEEAPAVVVLWTAASTQSRHVFDEATFGLDHSKLLAVRYGEAFRLPIGFGGIHTDDLTAWIDDGDETAVHKLTAELTTATADLEAEPVKMTSIPAVYEAPKDTSAETGDAGSSDYTESQAEPLQSFDDAPGAEDRAQDRIDAIQTAFVRHDPIPPSPPPSTAAGPVAWLRTNLFNGWFNTLLTVAAFYFLVQLAVSVVPWMANGVWNTNSLRECREALDGTFGACFSVITERWNQLLFGIAYPSDQYWRPTIAFVLLFVAAAPVLFFDLPRKMLIFTGLYPFLAYWLIWGGTVWAPIFALVGFIAGYFAYAALVKDSFAKGMGAGVASAFIIWIGAGYIIPSIASETPWLEAVASRDMGGFMLNMILGTVCVSLSLPLGILLALGRQSDMPIIKGICVVFIEFIRGVPLITLLFVANVVLAYFFPPGSNIDLILRVIIMITMFSAAYIAEVIRGGLAALPAGQYEAGDSLGLDYPQAMRLIILPQALKISIPGIVNVAVGLFKDTTLVSVISMFDLVGVIRGPILASAEWQGIYWELFMAASVLFFVICYGISQYSQWLERRLATDHR